MNYDQIWQAIDKIAKQNGLSLSGLAKKSGLDATTFNKSKRVSPNGKKRCPSLESLNKILDTCHLNFADFYYLAENKSHISNYLTVPSVTLSNIKNPAKFSPKRNDTSSWQTACLPFLPQNTYAVDVDSKNFEYPNPRTNPESVFSEALSLDRLIIKKASAFQCHEDLTAFQDLLVLSLKDFDLLNDQMKNILSDVLLVNDGSYIEFLAKIWKVPERETKKLLSNYACLQKRLGLRIEDGGNKEIKT